MTPVKRLLLTTTLILAGASAAAAGEVSQTADGAQSALNRFKARVVDNVAQVGDNTRNLAAFDDRADLVDQRSLGSQDVLNVGRTAGESGRLTQGGTNAGNIVRGAAIDEIAQDVGADSRQRIENDATSAGDSVAVAQSGSNMFNVVEVDEAVRIVNQDFPESTTQTVENTARIAGGSVSQDGVNIVNYLKARRVGTVIRRASGDQVVRNTVALRGDVDSVAQTGTNIANYTEVESFGEIVQEADGEQIIENTLHLNGHTAGRIVQGGRRVANMTRITPDEDTGDVDIDQTGNRNMTSRSRVTGDVTTGVTQWSSNASNSVTVNK